MKLEDGLWIEIRLKAQNGLQRVGTIPGAYPGAVHCSSHTQVPQGEDWIPICLCPCGCLASSQVSGSIPCSRSVRIDPVKGSRDDSSVSGHEAKSLIGYPLPSFGKVSIQTKQIVAVWEQTSTAVFAGITVIGNFKISVGFTSL